jgi:predicted transglutaminase-like cysteine proteinase
MRNIFRGLVAIAAITAISSQQSANAGFVGMPRLIGRVIERISFAKPTLAPMAFTVFCMHYSNQCKPKQTVFRGGPVRLNAERWADLTTVNRSVNAAIIPERNTEGLAGEKWLISPSSGDCNDYAVTKRSDLMQRGWPARSLLLSEVVTSWGEHHLILVVRTSIGDLVLDNMSAQIRPWSQVSYQWVRIQTPKNPNFWASLSSRNA